MGVNINKDTVAGIKILLKYSETRKALAFAICIGMLLLLCYILKGSETLHILVSNFNSNDKYELLNAKLDEVLNNQIARTRSDSAWRNMFETELKKTRELAITAVIFNEAIPSVIRKNAFKQAEELQMNHGIGKMFHRFISEHPEAAWLVDKQPPYKWIEDSNGVKHLDYSTPPQIPLQ